MFTHFSNSALFKWSLFSLLIVEDFIDLRTLNARNLRMRCSLSSFHYQELNFGSTNDLVNACLLSDFHQILLHLLVLLHLLHIRHYRNEYEMLEKKGKNWKYSMKKLRILRSWVRPIADDGSGRRIRPKWHSCVPNQRRGSSPSRVNIDYLWGQ